MAYGNMVSRRLGFGGFSARIFLKIFLANICSLILIVSSLGFFVVPWLLGILGTLTTLILIAFVASPVNKRGHSDHVSCKNLNKDPDKLFGLKVGLVANSPYFLLVILSILMHFGILPDWFFLIRVLNASLWPFITLIVDTTSLYDFQWYIFLYLFLLQLIVPITCHIAYTLGLKDIVLWDKIFYKKKTDSDQK